MTKSATQVMQEILFSAVVDAIVAVKKASQGLPNALLRDLGTVHANTTFADLPPSLRAAISDAVKMTFGRLLQEGYEVSPRQVAKPPLRSSAPRSEGPRRPRPNAGPGKGAPGDARGQRPKDRRGPDRPRTKS
ncbi:MAG: hypothetical protein JWN69_1834 [Alphaproteobacteria bacterium]|nr:hypothetical protein [Alphaproteobacteria bacterium]